MRPIYDVMLAAALTPLAAMPFALAQDSNNPNIYMVNYIEVLPSAKSQTAGMLKQLATASRQEGALRFEVLQRTVPTSHFLILEVWKDQKSDNAHELAAHSKEFRQQIDPLIGALYDQRWYKAL